MAKQACAQFHIDAAGGVAEYIGAQAVERALEYDHDDQADDQHVQGGEAFVDQHFVHHHLEEQRTDQSEQLQHEGDQQHLAEQLAVLNQGGDEPGKIEPREFAGQAGNEDQIAGPLRSEGFHRFDSGTRTGSGGVLKQYALTVALSEDDETGTSVVAVHSRERRQWRELQARDSRSGDFGFQAQVLGSPQQVARRDGLAGL